MSFLEVVEESIQDSIDIVSRYYEEVKVFDTLGGIFSFRYRDEVVVVVQVGEVM